ncbi:MAG: bifunctional phosphopantothenoylcysteine decarboxylase/phosphopantothenate--cysteine ligase CoaBC [Chloroflexi bacterium]|nr:bifunctional phosphopantothenoylcysteine decarboxylase/phosphopantothenate--cysteine ligase CoaBC [Chloroflexota bacterium]
MATDALRGRQIVLGVTGSIASYKAADIASKLAQAGALVDVILTKSAQQFIPALTFRSLTHRAVVTDLFDTTSEEAVEHVALARRADAVLIAPATANVIARLAHGLVDDTLTAVVLATQAPIMIAPAMEGRMWSNVVTQENVARLLRRGMTFIGPKEGHLASGATGQGRMEEPLEIIGALSRLLATDPPAPTVPIVAGDLAGTHIVVSAGGTQEPIDPVRIVTNRSSGKQGYALAEAARDRGARVTLVAAPTALADPVGIKVVLVATARQMLAAVRTALLDDADALVMAAAVADWESANAAGQKLKKVDGQDRLVIEMTKTPDILAEVRTLPGVKVGFAAETEDLLGNAREKLTRKGLDLIVANDVSATDAGFNVDTNRVVILDRAGGQETLPLLSKREVADRILDRVRGLIATTAVR